MNPMLTGGLIDAGGSVVNSVLGMIAGGRQDKRQRRQMKYAQELSKELWDYTNYGNQVKHMKNAGLNVGMMYDSGGQSATTGSFGTNAPMEEMGKTNPLQGMMMGSQVELQKAQAEKLKAETEKLRGVDTELAKTNVEAGKLANMFNNHNMNTALNMASQEYENEVAKNEILKNEGKISEAEANNRDNELKTSIYNTAMDSILKQSQNENVKANTDKIKEETSILFRDYLIRLRNANTQERGMLLNDYRRELENKLSREGLEQQDKQFIMSKVMEVMSMGLIDGGSVETYDGSDKSYRREIKRK